MRCNFFSIFIKLFYSCSVFLCCHLPSFAYYPKNFSTPLQKIAFGSCLYQFSPAPIWQTLNRTPMDLWIWMGDIVYADRPEGFAIAEASPTDLTRAYNSLFNSADYREFRETRMIIGTWDDHDYGFNDGGKDYTHKIASQAQFLNFVEEPEETKRRTQKGIYTSYVFGEIGRRVKIILLDIRYFRDDPNAVRFREYMSHNRIGVRRNEVYVPLTTILGQEQWDWLEGEVNKNDAELLLVVSGVQVLMPFRSMGESWEEFPHEKKRLLSILEKAPMKNIIILSGDKHSGMLFHRDFPSGKRIWDITSSGLNNASMNSPWYSGPFLAASVAASLVMGEDKFYGHNNFGLMEIDWENGKVDFAIHGENGEKTKVADSLLLRR